LRRKAAAACLLLVLGVSAWASRKIYILEHLSPDLKKKQSRGYSAEGNGFHFRNKALDVRVEPMTGNELQAYYRAQGVLDPFADFPPEANYVFFRLRIENLGKSDNLSFSPQGAMFGSDGALDDIGLYQLFYKENDGERRLAAAGKTLFLKNLYLPAGYWIERLLVFQYDNPYPTKKISLILSNILTGKEGLDLEFPFRADFRKEKVK
jgi:hypothetical protein